MSSRSKSINRKVYKFVHRENEYLRTTITGEYYITKNGFLEITKEGMIHINGNKLNGYAWDGCTPKFVKFDLIFGTPDGRLDDLTEEPITYYASMVHDALYQFKDGIPISRKSADIIFYKILKEAGFKWSWIYYAGVRLAGRILGKWNTTKKVANLRIIECSWINKAYNEAIKINHEQIDNHPLVKIAKGYS